MKDTLDIVNKFSSQRNIMVSFCEGCNIWTVHCPECHTNYCGSSCSCGCGEFVKKQQESLDNILEEYNEAN